MTLTFMWLDRDSAVKVKLVCQWVALMPALLSRKSIFFSGPPRMEVTCLLKAAIESCDPVSHSMIWRVAPLDLRDSREPRSPDRDRVAARMVLEESVLSWRKNSRPSPRFAPVITKIGIANCGGLLFDLGLFDVGAVKVLSPVNWNVGRINTNLIQLINLACERRNYMRDKIL